LVSGAMQRDVMAGDLYVFVGKDRRRAKVIYWDGTGLCVFAKRLEKGRFSAPWKHAKDGALRMTMSELALLLEGSEYVGRLALSPPPFVFNQEIDRA
jgi:transposase